MLTTVVKHLLYLLDQTHKRIQIFIIFPQPLFFKYPGASNSSREVMLRYFMERRPDCLDYEIKVDALVGEFYDICMYIFLLVRDICMKKAELFPCTTYNVLGQKHQMYSSTLGWNKKHITNGTIASTQCAQHHHKTLGKQNKQKQPKLSHMKHFTLASIFLFFWYL